MGTEIDIHVRYIRESLDRIEKSLELQESRVRTLESGLDRATGSISAMKFIGAIITGTLTILGVIGQFWVKD